MSAAERSLRGNLRYAVDNGDPVVKVITADLASLLDTRPAVNLEALTGELAKHQRSTAAPIATRWVATCSCGWQANTPGDYLTNWAKHRDDALIASGVLLDADEERRKAAADERDALIRWVMEQQQGQFPHPMDPRRGREAISCQETLRFLFARRAAAIRGGDA
jgi:hypothetical protein